MYALFSGAGALGSDSKEWCSVLQKLGVAAKHLSESHTHHAAVTGEERRQEEMLEQFRFRGAAFAYCPSLCNISWAQVASPESAHSVHIALQGYIENEDEMRELYSVHAAEAPPDSYQFTSSSAKLLLDLYWKGFSDAYGDYSAQPETCLASLVGRWSFVLYDEGSGYVLAAASPDAAQSKHLELQFCASSDGCLQFATGEMRDALEMQAQMGAFPGGQYFVRPAGEPRGQLASFVLHSPTAADAEEQAQVDHCSTMFRVASGGDISGRLSGKDVQAQ